MPMEKWSKIQSDNFQKRESQKRHEKIFKIIKNQIKSDKKNAISLTVIRLAKKKLDNAMTAGMWE